MEIIKRIKAKNGTVVQYIVVRKGKQFAMDAKVLENMADEVTNAYLTRNGFKARTGYTIKTEWLVTHLQVQKQPVVPKMPNIGNVDVLACYGKDFIEICRKIRQYASSGRLRLQESKHSSNGGNNIHLFKIIEMCNIDKHAFVCQYLSLLQPYKLKRVQAGKLDRSMKSDSSYWLIEMGYSVAMVVKVDYTDKNSPLVVSFHESNRMGKNTSGVYDFSDKLCAMIVDKCVAVDNLNYIVSFVEQSGFVTYRVNAGTEYYSNGVAYVSYEKIKKVVNGYLSRMIDKLYKTYMSSDSLLNIGSLGSESLNDRLSFAARGFAFRNHCIMLIDLYSSSHDAATKFELLGLMEEIVNEFDADTKLSVREALASKYGVGSYANDLYQRLIERLDS